MTENKKRILIVFFIVALFAGAVFLSLFSFSAYDHTVRIPETERTQEENILQERFTDEKSVMVVLGDSTTLSAEVARSEAKKTAGLSGKEPLEEGNGMLFVFDEPGRYSFWNKDMAFPIDIIWIHNDIITEVHEELPAFKDAVSALVTPLADANFVLEVNAGFVEDKGIEVGDSVTIISKE